MCDLNVAFEKKKVTVYTAYDRNGCIINTFFNKEDRDKAVIKNRKMERLQDRILEEKKEYLKKYPAENPYYGLQ
jgi:hypothetical protein